ncbi:hypothetical protein E2C01_032961 [Portunus trituberculatus]|uniref:Uncharacterized protein n=1 Tax=Portunus trituberculatus TaxID=210409 RepID=A0A5B7F152_PORTR|nr:hypothetical protein [Portunus trituberculatus]
MSHVEQGLSSLPGLMSSNPPILPPTEHPAHSPHYTQKIIKDEENITNMMRCCKHLKEAEGRDGWRQEGRAAMRMMEVTPNKP